MAPVRGAARKATTSMATSSSTSPSRARHATPVYTSSEAGSSSESDDTNDDSSQEEQPKAKKQRTSSTSMTTSKGKGKVKANNNNFAFLAHTPPSLRPSLPPTRAHAQAYHAPLLLARKAAQQSLLDWYASVSEKRSMPWRKPWLDPAEYADKPEELREDLKRRAYGVWISEIMLQQTRVETVIPYYNAWLARWPTIEALASASSDDVLACWKGLGYYSRATRLQAAAKDIVADKQCKGLLPSTPDELCEKVQGVGPYTAGAISAIAFGNAAPMVDGNVIRVLTRQLAFYASPKLSSTNALIAQAATLLVQAVSRDDADVKGGAEIKPSAKPGAWGQALMELGATICKPKPECGACPISATCRAYAEGEALAAKAGLCKTSTSTPAVAAAEKEEVQDIEDLCALCEPLQEAEEQPAKTSAKAKAAAAKAEAAALKAKAEAKQPKLSFGATFVKPKPLQEASSSTTTPKHSAAAMEVIVSHASHFPMKVVKAAAREEQCVVCVVRDAQGKVLIVQRPDKGLLASLWEFPALIVVSGAEKRSVATAHATSLLPANVKLRYETYHGGVTHLFSHIRLAMHVHSFTVLDVSAEEVKVGARKKWIEDVDGESLSTGNVRCWELITGEGKKKKSKSKEETATVKRKR